MTSSDICELPSRTQKTGVIFLYISFLLGILNLVASLISLAFLSFETFQAQMDNSALFLPPLYALLGAFITAAFFFLGVFLSGKTSLEARKFGRIGVLLSALLPIISFALGMLLSLFPNLG